MKSFGNKNLVLGLLLFSGINLFICGTVLAQNTKNQTASVDINTGNLTLVVPLSITFPKTIMEPNNSSDAYFLLTPYIEDQKIRIQDPSAGNAFNLTVTLENLMDPENDILSYQNIQMCTLYKNDHDSNRPDTLNVPSGIDPGVDIPNPQLNLHMPNAETSAETMYESDNNSTFFQPFVPDPLDPNYPNSAAAQQISIMQRAIANPNVSGEYSLGMAFHVTIPPGTPGKTFSGNLTFSLL